MEKAILKDNKAYCPKCNKCNYRLTNDYKLVEINGDKYVEFVARCVDGKCNEKFYYQSKITIENTIRYNFDKSNEIEIKEE